MITHDKTTTSVADSCASLKGEGLDEVCACCGIAEVDDVKLKRCDGGCDLVKYCSDKCQELHREQHEAACKKRKAELHDKKLFSQNDISHLGECPICFLPLSIDPSKSTMMGCCSKIICMGCNHANRKREREQGLEPRCAFCREPTSKSQEEQIKQTMERIKNNDSVAMTEMGKKYHQKGEYDKALEYYAKAAELGNANAHSLLGALYYRGNGVEEDVEKAIHHWEHAAIAGHTVARGLLGFHEKKNGRSDRAAKHYIIAANLGCNISLQSVKKLFVAGIVSKEDYAAALRAYQAAVDATKSAERERAEANRIARRNCKRT
jgi:hypothetical protein